MTRFFSSAISENDDHFILTGHDAAHITNSLRMKPEEQLIICNHVIGIDFLCAIISTSNTAIKVKVLKHKKSYTEPSIKVTLFQAMPKADKFESIVQKSVELGVKTIVPVMTRRCISRPDNDSMSKKIVRFNRIAYEAACQSSRSIIPKVHPMITFDNMINEFVNFDLVLFFYENGGKPLTSLDFKGKKEIAVVIGPEGGFDEMEFHLVNRVGAAISTLGPRILRTETAPICALSAIMCLTGNLE